MGGNNKSQDHVKADSKADNMSGTLSPVLFSLVSDVRPRIKYKIRHTKKEGNDVYMVWRICVYSGVPVAREAMLVVSDNGDNLSPK